MIQLNRYSEPKRNTSTPVCLRDEGVVSGHASIDWSTSTAKRITVTAPCALAFEKAYAGDVYVLEIEHDHDGAAAIDWPDAITWATTRGNVPPTLSSGRGLRDLLCFYCDGVGYIGTEYARGIPSVARKADS